MQQISCYKLAQGCSGTFMHENAAWQHRRDSTYTVPYVPADSTTESRYCPFDVKAKVEQGPYDIIRVYSCRAQTRIRARVERQADRPIAEKRCWRRRMPPGHATVRRD